MRPFAILLSVFSVLSAGRVYAQEIYDYKGVGTYDFYTSTPVTGEPSGNPGMRVIKIGAMELLVPEGMRVFKSGSQMVTEGLDSYMARKFDEMNKRLDKIEEAIGALSKEIEALKAAGKEEAKK